MIKTFKIIYYILFAFIVMIILFLLVSVLPITGNYKFYIVQSGSMEPAISTGGLIVVKPVDEYKIGDVISFGKNSKIKDPTTHRIHDIKIVGDNISYITKGDANNASDQTEVKKENIIGKVLFDISYFGYVVSFVKRPIGFLLVVMLPVLAVVIDELRKIFKELKKQKSEKQDKN